MTANIQSKILLLSATALSVLSAVVPVAAQEADENLVTDSIIVTGYRSSLANAIDLKKTTRGVSDGIGADDIGVIPDLDLAEALQRVTGVQVNRNNRNRTGTVTLRGLPETFGRVTLNGQTIVNPNSSNNEGGGIGFPFGILDSDVISGVNFIKSPTPEYVEGGLSGIIDIKTRDPLNGADFATVEVGGRHETLADSFTPAVSGAFSKKLNDQLGVAAAIGYQGLEFRRDSLSVNGYSEGDDGFFRPNQVRETTTISDGFQLSASADASWRPTDNLSFDVSGIFARQELDTTDNIFRFQTRGRSTVTDLAAPTADGTIFGVSIENPRFRLSGRLAEETWEVFAINQATTWSNDDWTLSGYVNYSEGSSARPFLFGNLDRGDVEGGNGVTIDVNTGGGDLDQFIIDVQNNDPIGLFAFFDQPLELASNGGTVRATSGAPAGWSYFGGNFNTTQESDEISLGGDVKKRFETAFLDNIKVGFQYRDESVEQETLVTTLIGATIDNLGNSILTTGGDLFGSDFFNGKIDGLNPNDFVAFDAATVNALLTPIDLGAVPDNAVLIGGLAAFPDGNAAQRTYDVDSRYLSFFAQAGLKGEIGGVAFDGDVGVRYVDIDRDATFFTASGDFPATAFEPVAADRSFDFWLPSGFMAFNLTDELVLRVAGARTIVPINPQDFQVTSAIDIDDQSGDISVDLGSANLPPFDATSYDVALEWYNRPGGLFAVTLFQKDINAQPVDQTICPADGGGLGFGALTFNNGLCTVDSSGAQITITETGTDSYTLRGVEFTAQQNFDFLPGLFGNLGGQFNYTYVDVREDFEIAGISNHTLNVIGFYETERWGLRAAYNYRDEYFFASTSTIFGDDLTIASRGQLDLSANVNITDQIALSFEAFNVTNEKLEEFEEIEERFRRANLDGRTFQAAVRYTW